MALSEEEIIDLYEKKYKKYEAAEKFLDSLVESGFEMDDFIKEQVSSVKDVLFDMQSKENKRIGSASFVCSDSYREKKWKEMNAWKGFLEYSEDRKKSIKNFFEKMDTTIMKSQGFKECYEVFYETLTSRNQSKVDRWQKEKRKLENEIDELRYSLGYEPTYDNIYKEIKESKEYIEKLQKKVEAGQGNEKENNKRSVLEELEYQKEELKVVERKLERFDRVVKEAKALKDEINPSVVKNAVVDKVAILHEFSKLHQGNHKNSKEFNRMEAAYKIVEGWGQENVIDVLKKMDKPPQTLQEALGLLKKETENYLKEKKEQWRPFPSERRTSRITAAEMLSGYVDSMLEDIQSLPPEKQALINQPTIDALAQSKEAAKSAPEYGQKQM